MRGVLRILPLLYVLVATAAHAQPLRRYALILGDAPLAKQVLTRPSASRAALSTPSAGLLRQKLSAAQGGLKAILRQRKIGVVGSVQTLANAVFVLTTSDRVGELKALPGVTAVVPMQRLHRTLNQALPLVNASGAWTALGGAGNAGAGMKIAILDSGIDETHPGFIDSTLTTPAGYPVSDNPADAAHATNKIIAVRSFVSMLASGNGTPESTLPDDLSPVDHVGHGTAVAMIAAGVSVQSPIGAISGVAPKAWLGNYKIFGSPGVNDETSADVVLAALDAAFNDGMNVALLSAGDFAAVWAPTDSGATCDEALGTVCDALAGAVSTAEAAGMTVVLPAGNDGQSGLDTINSPGDVDSAITVGATTNAHLLSSIVSDPSGDQEDALMGDGPQLQTALTAPLFPVASIDSTELGCVAYPAGSLTGKIALLTVGSCGFALKVINAEAAGAVAVLIFNQAGSPAFYQPTGLENTGIPAAMVSAASGAFLKTYLMAHAGASMTINPATADDGAATANTVAYFSSRGPNVGDSSIKPDLVAPGASIYTAAQDYDPNGDLYSANRYIGVSGTSFAAAFAAGAAALVMQAHPSYSAAQIKSALTNTASGPITDYDANGNPSNARTTAIGGGQLNIGNAITSTITVVPATVSFGVVSSPLPTRGIAITNTGSASATIQLTVNQRDADANAKVTVSPSSLTLAAGQSMNVSVAMTGATPAPGTYEGAISVTGGAVPMQIPYLYLVGSGVPASMVPLFGNNFVTESGSAVDLAFTAIDRSGVPVVGEAVRFAPAASVYAATPATDQLGIGEAYLFTPNTVGPQSFAADLISNAAQVNFPGRTRPGPQIETGGVVDAASFLVPQGFAPGSYISIFGTGLSESREVEGTNYLPVSLAGVSVSFGVPSMSISVPAHFYFVSSGQISVQIPWELAGASSAVMKITLAGSSSMSVRADDSGLGTYQSQLVTIPIASYEPAFFEYLEASSGNTLAAALDQNYNLVSSANPIPPGKVIQFFVNGLGPVTPGTQPASGQPSPGTAPLAMTTTQPTVSIGRQPASVVFSGLAPDLVGLYQVNVIVPDSAPAGIDEVVLSVGGVTAKTLVPVQ